MPRILLRRFLPLILALVAAAALAACTSSKATSTPASTSSGSSSGAGSGASGGGSSGAGVGSVSWRGCNVSGVVGTSMKCANLSVPLNYSDPSGRKITLALAEVPASVPASQQLGDLLVNPGGPGASGLSLAAEAAQLLNAKVARRYNIIGFDPRGVGSSVPALHCDTSFFSGVRPNYIPANAAAEQVLENRAKTYAQDCEKQFGWFLPYLTTKDTARDMDSIRTALGQSKISYYAFSYGTYIGQVYATMFPTHVKRMVLDSTVDPSGIWYTDNIEQDYAFQGRQEAFFAWMAKYDSSYGLGTTAAQVQTAYYDARNKLLAHPIDGSNGQPLIGADELDDTFLQGGYDDELWPGLAQALSAYLRQGSTSALVSQYQQNGAQNENEFAIYNAVQCSDVNWPRSWAKWDSDTRKVYATAPFQAWDNAWYNAACVYWPVKGPATPMKIGAPGLPGILMLQGTLDPATPYAGAQVAHSDLPTARMVVVEGGGNHGQSLEIPPDNCVQNYLNNYLASGALPSGTGPVDATCAPVAAPNPAS